MLRAKVALVCALLLSAPARAEAPRVARGELRGEGGGGLVCFLSAPGKVGVVAVGAAHSFDRTRLAEVGEIAFTTARGAPPIATSRRYFAKPGRAYHLPGSSPRDDFVVFALEAAPADARALMPAEALPGAGTRVEILGLGGEPTAEIALPGTVARSGPGAIEVELDARADFRGWGGAPVVLADGGRVVGLLQAARPSGERTRATVGPIAGALGAIAQPFEGGLGRLFATMAPPPSAANSPSLRRRAGETPVDERSPEATAARLDEALRDTVPPVRPDGALAVTIETPEPDAIFGDTAGAFLAGRALDGGATRGRYDVILAIDTSRSAHQPSGVDVDGDGVVGVAGPAPDRKSSDQGDSILAAEVAAARNVVEGLDPKRTRVGIVSFAGDAEVLTVRDIEHPHVRNAAITREPLTSDYRRVRDALSELGKVLPFGMTHMAAGIDLATLELLGLAGSLGSADPESTKLILFFTDGQPTLPYPASVLLNASEVMRASGRARRAGVRIHSFAIGPEALAGPFAAVEMAAITDGLFTPVPDPGRLSEFLDAMRLSAVAEIAVRNTTSGADAHEARLHADGSWEALVPLAVGKNLLEVRARGGDGEEARATILVHYAPGAARGVLPAELVDRYNRLLEGRLLTLTAEQRERQRRELVLEIERERARAVERAETQRKELELRAEGQATP